MDSLESQIPSVLHAVISSIYYTPRTASAKECQNLKKIAISHAIMQSAGTKTYVSPLLLSIGIFIHQTTRSKLLLNVLSSFGFCACYSQVMDIEKSAVSNINVNDLMPGITSKNDGGGFCQWVADNFDLNEEKNWTW